MAALHHEIADQLRTGIERGDYPPGSRLPSERALIQQTGASNTTVRAAIAALKAEGLVVSGAPRHGNVVRERPRVRLPSSRYAGLNRQAGIGPWQTTCRAAGVEPGVDLVEVAQDPADQDTAERLGIEPGAPVVIRRRILLADGIPVQIYDGWHPLDLIEGTPLTGNKLVGGIANTYASLGLHPTRAKEEVISRGATEAEGKALRLPMGSPVLALVRITYDDHINRALDVLHVVASGEAISLVYEDLPL